MTSAPRAGVGCGDRFDPAVAMAELGARWEIGRNYFKRFACVRYAHGLLDALERLAMVQPEHRREAAAIVVIEARAHAPVGRLTEADSVASATRAPRECGSRPAIRFQTGRLGRLASSNCIPR